MDQFLFARRFLAAPGRVGSLLPSSRRLARQVAAEVPWQRCTAVAEFGPGTGRITEAVLQRLPAGCRLLLFEADPDFRTLLRRRYPGVPVYDDAAHLRQALAEQGLPGLDLVVSGIPFAVLPAGARQGILAQVGECLAPGGLFLAYQYTPNLYLYARPHFRQVQCRLVLWNLPPALVLRCSNGPPS